MLGFGKKLKGAIASAKKMENKDLVEACIGGMVLLAYADGECEDSELGKLKDIIAANPTFSQYQSEIQKMVDSFSGLMKAGPTTGRMKIMKEIKDLKNASENDKEEAFACMIDMAQADGEVEPAERKVLDQIGREFGLNPDNYLA